MRFIERGYMQHLSNIFHIPAALLLFLLMSCSGNEKIIPQKTMTQIVGEMYLADQYIEERPHLRAQTDSLIVYEAVTQRHGYSFADYRTSVQYYLTKGDALKNIHVKARKQLLKRKEVLSKVMAAQIKANRRIRWWAEDSIGKKHINDLWKEPYLRNLKWLAGYEAIQTPDLTDTAAFDTPQNMLWWRNNISLGMKNSPADSLYPILQRDHLIWQERNKSLKSDTDKSKKSAKPATRPDKKAKGKR